MGVWEFLRFLIGSKDNPLVKYGARHGGGYVLLSVAVFYLLIGGGVWFFWGMHRDYVAAAAVLGGSGLCLVWSGLCFVLFTPRHYHSAGLEELWLTRLSRKEVVAGLLFRPLQIVAFSLIAPYLMYIYLCFKMDNYFDEILSGVLVMPLSGALIASAVFAKRWITHLRAGFVYFLSGLIKSCLYLGVASLCCFFVGAFTYNVFNIRGHIEVFYWTLWIPFVVMAWVVWRLDIVDLPERLFRFLDEDVFAEKNWFVREREAWCRVSYRKKAILRQRRFLYPRLRNVVLPLVVFLMLMGVAGGVGYFQYEYYSLSYDYVHSHDYTGRYLRLSAGEVLPLMGVVNALFSVTSILGLSVSVPVLLVHCIVGEKKKNLFFPRGTLMSGLVRFALQMTVFQIFWCTLGFYVSMYLFPGYPYFRTSEETLIYLIVQIIYVLPISMVVFMLLIPWKLRRLYSWVLLVISAMMIIGPLFLAKYVNRVNLLFIHMDDDYIVSLMVLYSAFVLLFIVAGYNWLGARYYRLLDQERGNG